MCGTPLHQLRRLALHSALGLELDDAPDLQSGHFSGLLTLQPIATSALSPRPSWEWPNQSLQPAARPHPTRAHGEPAAGVKRREMGWIKSGAAGTGIKPTCLATVTPLPFHAQHYLEGVWSVTRVSRVQQQQQTQVRVRITVWSEELNNIM